MDQLDKLAETRRNRILHSETDIICIGTAFFVSADGSDENDGLSPDTPWATLTKVNQFPLQPGDAVFFRRGCTFRGALTARDGVTYSAYGDGPKPILCASPFNGARYGEWIPTEVPDIYRFSEKLYDDVGCLVFDDGAAFGYKATVHFNKSLNLTDGTTFRSWRDLSSDLSFYHDLGGPNICGTDENSTLYLKSTQGNPAERFHSIEFNVRTNGIQIAGHNIRINNLCVRCCGCHGVGAWNADGLTVDWCTFEWIGGSMQFYCEDSRPVRFGNAVEIYGSCTDFTVENCYINQVYDAGITHQFSSDTDEEIVMRDVQYRGNLIENCVYSIEYFNGRPSVGKPEGDPYRCMSHVRISDNIMRFAGEGFGKQRPDPFTECHIKGWDHYNCADNMIYENNIMDRSTYCLLHIGCYNENWMPIIRRNIFIQNNGAAFAKLGATPTTLKPYTETTIENEKFVDSDNVFYVID